MFEYLRLDLSKSNQEIKNIKNTIEPLKNDLLNSEKPLSLMSSKFQVVSLTNHELINEKIIGGNLEETVNIFIHTETGPSFPTKTILFHEYKTKFVSSGFINRQDLMDKHYVTNPNRLTLCAYPLTALEPSVKPPNCEYDIP